MGQLDVPQQNLFVFQFTRLHFNNPFHWSIFTHQRSDVDKLGFVALGFLNCLFVESYYILERIFPNISSYVCFPVQFMAASIPMHLTT